MSENDIQTTEAAPPPTSSEQTPKRLPEKSMTRRSRIKSFRELIRKSEEKTMYDGKTGLHNSKWLDERLSTAIRESDRTGKGFFIEFMDLDNFKAVNSRFDHSGGDEVLKLFTKIKTRPTEEVARFGGDEFVQILNDDISGTEAIAVAIRNAAVIAEESKELISQLSVTDRNTPQIDEVTLSLGLVQYRPGMSLKEIQSEASQMMLEGKNKGKDLIAVKGSDKTTRFFGRDGKEITTPEPSPIGAING